MDNLLAGRRILIVEDEMLVLMMAEDCLESLGCTHISAAATVQQALEKIDAERFDAAILDVNLLGERSDKVADTLSHQGTPFFFVTGYGKTGVREQDRDHPIVTKPYFPSDLEAVFKTLLPRREDA